MLFLYLNNNNNNTNTKNKQNKPKNKNKIDVYLSNGLRWPNSDSFIGWADGTKGQQTNQNVVKTKRNCFGQKALSVVHLRW